MEELLNKFQDLRIQYNHQQRLYNNASFRLSSYGSDAMWKKYQDQAQEELMIINDSLNMIYQLIIEKATKLDAFSKSKILQRLGIIIASTENIEFVKNNLSDAQDLQKAIDSVSDVIKEKYQELQECNNINEREILSAELNYYYSDLNCHYWGMERLKYLQNEILENKIK